MQEKDSLHVRKLLGHKWREGRIRPGLESFLSKQKGTTVAGARGKLLVCSEGQVAPGRMGPLWTLCRPLHRAGFGAASWAGVLAQVLGPSPDPPQRGFKLTC